MLGEGGFVVPGIDLAGATIHEQPDHTLGACGHMGRLRRQWVAIDRYPQEFLVLQEGGKTKEPRAAASTLKEIAASDY